MKLRNLIGAVAIAATLPVAAQAVMISGQLDIGGEVNVATTQFVSGGNLDFNGNGFVVIASGDFDTFVDKFDTVTLNDLTFTAPVDVYSVGGFTFTATNFFNFDNDPSDMRRGFSANGVLSGNGFDETPGLLTLSTQRNTLTQIMASFSSTTTAQPIPLPASVLMLMAGLAGLGVVSRKRKTETA